MAVEQARTAVAAAGPALAEIMVEANSADPSVLVEHLTVVHEATGAGIVLQDYPEVSGVRIIADQVLAVVEHCPFVVAVKSEAPPWLPLVNFEAQPSIGPALRQTILHRRGVFAEPAVRRPSRTAPDEILELLPVHLAAVQDLFATTTGRS